MTSIWHSISALPEYAAAPATGAAAVGAGAGLGPPLPLAGEGWGEGGAADFGVAAAPCAAPSSVRITLPSLTLSPNLTLSSLTVPAAGEGTSIVALSDSRVTSESSAFTVSPGLTKTSMTGTSLKSPMSGTLTSIVLMKTSKALPHKAARSPRNSADSAHSFATFCVLAVRLLQHHAPHVAEKRDEVTVETGRRRAIDHAVVEGQRQRQDQSRVELLAVPYRSRARAAHAEDRDLRRIDDRREVRAADAAQAGDREAAA